MKPGLLKMTKTTDVALAPGTTENSMDVKKGSKKAKQSETKSPR